MPTFKNFPQGLTNGTTLSTSLSTTSGDKMNINISASGDLYADNTITFASQGNVGQTWQLVNDNGGVTNAAFPGAGTTLNETSAIAIKMTGIWLTAMPNVLQRILDVRNTTTGTIARAYLTTGNFPMLQTSNNGASAVTVFTGTQALVHDFEYRFELGLTIATSGATLNFDTYLANNPSPLSGNSYTSSAGSTGTGAVNLINYMQGSVAGGGTWVARFGGFEAVTGSATEIGPYVSPAGRPHPIKVYSQAVKRAGTW